MWDLPSSSHLRGGKRVLGCGQDKEKALGWSVSHKCPRTGHCGSLPPNSGATKHINCLVALCAMAKSIFLPWSIMVCDSASTPSSLFHYKVPWCWYLAIHPDVVLLRFQLKEKSPLWSQNKIYTCPTMMFLRQLSSPQNWSCREQDGREAGTTTTTASRFGANMKF